MPYVIYLGQNRLTRSSCTLMAEPRDWQVGLVPTGTATVQASNGPMGTGALLGGKTAKPCDLAVCSPADAMISFGWL